MLPKIQWLFSASLDESPPITSSSGIDLGQPSGKGDARQRYCFKTSHV